MVWGFDIIGGIVGWGVGVSWGSVVRLKLFWRIVGFWGGWVMKELSYIVWSDYGGFFYLRDVIVGTRWVRFLG